MGRETDSWFSMWWRKELSDNGKGVIGILAFEVAGLMSKLVNLWHVLSDREVIWLRKQMTSSIGLQKLVVGDENYLMDLALNEIMENFGVIARYAARLGKRCTDPVYQRFELFINDPAQKISEWNGWEYRLKKMERKMKKMERFVSNTLQLSQELEVLAEQEQTLRRIKANPELDRVKLYEYQQKVLWQRQEVKHLRDTCPWNRTYDYISRLLMRSLFTVLQRLQHVFGINQLATAGGNNECRHIKSDCLPRSHSFSALSQSPVYPTDSNLCFYSSGPLGRVYSKSGRMADKYRLNHGPVLSQHSSTLPRKQKHSKSKRFSHTGPFKGCMNTGVDSPVVRCCEPTDGSSARFSRQHVKDDDQEETKKMYLSSVNGIYYKLSLIKSKCALLTAPPSTLGHAALALHYANVIILIEKLASSPHLIGFDARDDLYKMLTASIRGALRARLKSYGRTLASSVYSASLAADWNLALVQILDWLSPLAHNMIKWHSEHNYEKENTISGSNVLLVQTLYYANQAKTEAAIVELLVGLNYICRISIELNQNAPPQNHGCRALAEYLLDRDAVL